MGKLSAPMTSFSIVSLILEGKKNEPVVFSVSGKEKFPMGETVKDDVTGAPPILGPTLNDKPLPSDLSQLDLRQAR